MKVHRVLISSGNHTNSNSSQEQLQKTSPLSVPRLHTNHACSFQLCSLVARTLRRHRKSVGSIPAEDRYLTRNSQLFLAWIWVVSDFLSKLRPYEPLEFIVHPVKCHKIINKLWLYYQPRPLLITLKLRRSKHYRRLSSLVPRIFNEVGGCLACTARHFSPSRREKSGYIKMPNI